MVLVGGSTATSHGRRSMSKLIDIKSILIYKVWNPISDSGGHDRQKPNQLKYGMWHTLCKTLHLYTVPTSIKLVSMTTDYLYMSRFEFITKEINLGIFNTDIQYFYPQEKIPPEYTIFPFWWVNNAPNNERNSNTFFLFIALWLSYIKQS